MKECMYCCTDAKQPSAQGPSSKEASLACMQPSVTETYCQLTRVVLPHQLALSISPPAIVLLATKAWRVAGVCNAQAKDGNGVIRVPMYGTGGVALGELELKSGVQPRILLPNDRHKDLTITRAGTATTPLCLQTRAPMGRRRGCISHFHRLLASYLL